MARWYRVRSIHGPDDCSPVVEGFASRESGTGRDHGVTLVVLAGVAVRLRPELARELFELGEACEEGWEPQWRAFGAAVRGKEPGDKCKSLGRLAKLQG